MQNCATVNSDNMAWAYICWCGGLMVRALYFDRASGYELWPGHCVVFLGKTLYSHSASLHPGSYMQTLPLC